MGQHDVSAGSNEQEQRRFMRALLDDVTALERMIHGGFIESGTRRIGAEQEYFLIGPGGHPACVAPDVLERLTDPPFTSELARFNLEANLEPQLWGGGCLRRLEQDLAARLAEVRAAARACDADVILTGILPTLRLQDLTLENMMPHPRYHALNEAMLRSRGERIPIRIRGIDEFYVLADGVMLEGCNTSLQLHFQVGPEEFAAFYNAAQAITGPVLAGATNSPVLAEHRLWEETRVALFQHSVDDRSSVQRARGRRPRVLFGDHWVEESVLEIFREDVARFRVVLTADAGEASLDVLDRGELPHLRSLCLHNGTVWRWNRACYGVHEDVAHLRIENRMLPAGPSVLDEVANAAFFYGLLVAVQAEYGDVRHVLAFDHAKTNFMAAARRGLHAQFTWIDGERWPARDLLLERLIPLAREGLEGSHIHEQDIARYLGTYERRVRLDRTGSRWMNESLEEMGMEATRHERHRTLTLATLARQKSGEPVHRWPLAKLDENKDWTHGFHTVGLFMTRDLFTVRPDDVVDLAANLMDWRHIRHVPVEDMDGHLVGMLSHRDIVALLSWGPRGGEPLAVHEIMKTDLVTVTPETTTLAALEKMRERRVGCLPVVEDDRLVGIVSERDFLAVTHHLLRERLDAEG